MRRKIVYPALFFLVCGFLSGQGIYNGIPAKIDPAAKYLIYVHGRIIETQKSLRPKHKRHGYYEYEKILETLRDKGFLVISEARMTEAEPAVYAETIAERVNALIRAGVPPRRITVIGASKGGIIAVYASSLIHNPKVNFIIMASCGDRLFNETKANGVHLYGNVLSIYDADDESGDMTCRKFFEAAKGKGLGRSKEIKLTTGLGHGILYRPIPEWVEPATAWANEMAALHNETLE
jgi:hypothetical protein